MKPQEMVPGSRLGRARMLMLVFGVLLALTPVAQFDPRSPVLPLSIIAEVAIFPILLGTAWRRRHVTLWEAPATALLAVLVGVSLQDPLAASEICVGVILTQTFYDRRWNSGLRLVSFLPVLPLAAWLAQSPAASRLPWDRSSVLSGIATPALFLALALMLKEALASQEASLIRERFVARFTGRLLVSPVPEAVTGILKQVTDELCEAVPGMLALAVRRSGAAQADGSASVLKLHGDFAGTAPARIPAEVLAPLRGMRLDDLPELPGGARTMAGIGLPKQYSWRILPMHVTEEFAERFGVDTMIWGIPRCFSESWLGIPGPASTEALDLLRTVTEHGAAALQVTAERTRLLADAVTDDATGLLNRTAFDRRLDQLIGVTGGSITLLLARFPELEVAVGPGMATGAAALAQLGSRFADAAEDGSLVARFSDAAFALALPGTPSREQLEAFTAGLRERLAEPITVPAGPLSLRVLIGLAQGSPGESAEQLLERAGDHVRAQLAAGRPVG